MDRCRKACFFLQYRNDFIGNLPRNRVSLIFRNVVHQKNVGVFLVERKRIDLNDLVFADQPLEDPSMTFQKTAINHDCFLGTFDPARHR